MILLKQLGCTPQKHHILLLYCASSIGKCNKSINLKRLFEEPQTTSLREKLDFCFAMEKSHLTLEQRYQIQAWLAIGTKQKEITSLIGKDKSVIK